MTTTTDPRRPEHPDAPTGPIPALDTTPATARHRRHPDHGGPGTTRVENAVVEKIAGQLVGEVEHVGGAAGQFLGIAVGPQNATRSPKVDARVDGEIVTLRIRLSVTYPAPIGQVTDTVRAHVIDRLHTLTGLRVPQVDITVAALHPPQTARRELR